MMGLIRPKNSRLGSLREAEVLEKVYCEFYVTYRFATDVFDEGEEVTLPVYDDAEVFGLVEP